MNEQANSRTWLAGGPPGHGLARAFVRTDADRAEVEKHRPLDLLPAHTVHGCIAAAMREDPDKTAVVQPATADPLSTPRTLTYAQFLRGIEQAACLFVEAAGAETPVVSVICPLLPEGLMAIWGAETVGIANPINPFLDLASIITILNRIGTHVLVAGSSEFGPGAWDKLQEIAAAVPTLKRVYVVGGQASDEQSFERALERVDVSRFASVPRRDGADDAVYMPTGGTTGAPKLVRQTQERQLIDAWLMGALNGSAPDEVVALGMPTFHVGGLVAIALRAMLFGQTLVILTADGFRNPAVLRDFWRIAEVHGVTNVIATPTTAAALQAAPAAMVVQHRIRNFGCGGSTIPVELLHAFHKRFGLYLREVWGMTEFHGVTTGHPNDGNMPAIGSVGRAFAFHEVRAAVLEGRRFVRDAAPGERGILIVRGICVGDGYVDARQNDDLFVVDGPDGEAWANTGDIGAVDDVGHVWVYGRDKDLIVRGGNKIDPRVIEEALQQHPAVQVSAAIGQPDARRGEMPVAYIQLKAGAVASEAELLAFCAERIAEKAAVPVGLTLLRTMPMTAVGKIAKPALRVDALKKVATAVAAEVAGPDSVLGIDVDATAGRPTAVLRMHAPRAQHDELAASLRAAFLSFEFKTQFDLVDR
ncbi:AMP-binding protein [Variovorax sp. dw_954]|uniref:AMP-binding protein n=1 Tax=Variovorax sp. dw_954 TaxID=2720078 RepID=UPI001BD5C0E7|nr:AMP-binding protein [Variovorax sp. dw_954]